VLSISFATIDLMCCIFPVDIVIVTVVGTKPCIPHPLEVSGNGIRGVEGVADKEAKTVQTININSQLQYFVARRLW
jgi:hypothetical protein